jgi:WD40 repeat protein
MSVIKRVPSFLVSLPIIILLCVSEKSEKAGRQQAEEQQPRRLLRHVLALGAVLGLGGLSGCPQAPPSVLSAAQSSDGKWLARRSTDNTPKLWEAETGKELLALGGAQEEPSSPAPTVTLGIKISLSDGSVFYIPVIGNGEMLGVIAVSKGHFAGIRITPSMKTDSVKINVSALVTARKKLSEATCDEVSSWPSEDAGSYEWNPSTVAAVSGPNGARERKEDESLSLSGLARLGLPVFKVKIVRALPPPPGWAGLHHARPPSLTDSFGYCGCDYSKPRSIIRPEGGSASGVGGIMSFAGAGKCVEIRGCGQCCRILTRNSLLLPRSQ